ncbi:MAG: hypothetical protein KAY32_07570 [Candidatus Eisenbacteria sp.]|nr:hypothetical protein [Candidatus Eisenbacteria bacterium]
MQTSCGSAVDIDLLHAGQACHAIADSVGNTGMLLWEAAPCSSWIDGYQICVLALHAGVSDTSAGSFGFIPGFSIRSIIDINDDQGGQVGVSWYRSPHDGDSGPTLTSYGVYRRRQRAEAGSEGSPIPDQSMGAVAGGTRIDGWDFLMEIPAHGDSVYQCVAATLCDSTAQGGACWSSFFIRAMTPDPLEYYDAAPDSGYSVDNLAPNAPGDLHFAMQDWLVWDASPAPDFNYFTVYGSMNEQLEESADPLTSTTDTTTCVEGHPYTYYHVTATDIAGNEGLAATVGVPAETPLADYLPAEYMLARPRPSPSTSGMVIGFALPEEGEIELRILDAAGRTLTVLAKGYYPMGFHSVTWGGRTASGAAAASGVYFCQLKAGGRTWTQRVLLLR